MTPHEKIVAAAGLGLILLAVVLWAFHWWVLDARYWLPSGLRRQAPDYLPGPQRADRTQAYASNPGLRAGELHDEWEQLDPDQAAAQLIAEWHGGVWHDAEGRTEQDVWDQWWAGVDGLERECMLVHDWLVREERLWAELKAETRELCPA